MPAAAASALRPMATRTPLMAMTAVQALCRMAKRIPDQPNSCRRERSESAESSLRVELSALAICRGTVIECSGVGNLRPIGSRIHGVRIFWRIWRLAARRLGRAREGGPDLRYKCRSDSIRMFRFGQPRQRENGLCRASGASLLLLDRAL